MAGFSRLRYGRLVALVLLVLSTPTVFADTLSVTLEWDPNPELDIQGYYVYRSPQSGAGYSRLNATPNASTAFTDNSLTPGLTYYYVCTALGSDGLESGFSNEVSYTVSDPTNTPPAAVGDSITLQEDGDVLIDVIANDLDADGDPLSVVGFTQPQFGIVDEVSNQLHYAPLPNFHGGDSFTYTIADGRGGESTATVSLAVVSVNDAPQPAADQTAVTSADPITIDVLGNDTDPDGDVLSVASVSDSAGLVVNNQTSITYTAAEGFSGIDSFSYVVIDGQGGSAIAAVQVDVRNNAPIAEDDWSTIEEDSAANLDVTANDIEPDGDPITITEFTQPKKGTVVPVGNGLRYTPPLDFHGEADFTYNVTDGRGAEATASVHVEVTPVNDKPEARSDQVRLCRKKCSKDTPALEASLSAVTSDTIFIDVLENDIDVDGDTLIVASVSQGQGGAVTFSDNQVVYQLNDGFSGTDTLEYSITDGNGESSSATIRVIVDAENRPPSPQDDWSKAESGQPVAISLLSNDSDPDGDLFWLVDVSETAAGTIEGISPGAVRFVPRADFVGTATFSYTLSDGELEATATVTVEVGGAILEGLVFPMSIGSTDGLIGDPFIGVALVNTTSRDEIVSLTVRDASGTQVASQTLDGPLQPGGQKAFLTVEVADALTGASSLAVAGAGSALNGLFSVVDPTLERMDAVGARVEPGRTLYFHQMRHLPNETVVVYLFNPSTQIAEISVALFGADGQSIAQVDPVLAPSGSLRGTLSEVFGELPEIEEGYARITSNVAIHGFAVRASEDAFAAEAAVPAVRADEVLAPHFFFNRDGSDRSRLRILNPDGVPVAVEIEAFANDGSLLATHSLRLEPHEMLAQDIDELLDFENVEQDVVTGYLRIRATPTLWGQAAIIGSVEFSGFSGLALSSLPLSRIGSQDILFPHVAQASDGSLFTGIALLNPLADSITVAVEAFEADGRLAAWREVGLGPGERLVDLLTSEALFGEAFHQVGGHLRVRGSGPVVATAIIGSVTDGFLSAIEGQPLTMQTPQ